MMKSKYSFTALVGGALLICALVAPGYSRGGDSPDLLTAAVQEVVSQQTIIADNQAKIDAKIAEVAEELRLARIFVARGK